MKLTNNHNLPQPIIKAITRDNYSKGNADFSVTEIIDSPRVRALQAKHHSEMTEDASERVWSLLGRAVHTILEMAADDGHRAEERLFLDVDGYILSGGMDLQSEGHGNGVGIADYKVTSTFAVMKNKPEWERQLNVYAHLVRKVRDKEVRSLTIIAICRDWTKAKTDNPDYPQAPIVQIDIPLWEPQVAEEYVRDRIQRHVEARKAAFLGKPLPACTPEEMWLDPPKYAVQKPGAARATKVFDDLQSAKQFVVDNAKGLVIEERQSQPRRCDGGYCGVSQWCSQYAAWKQSNRTVPSLAE